MKTGVAVHYSLIA